MNDEKNIKKTSNIGFLELRFVNTISSNSFSSVQWKNKYIRTLDFNFENLNQESECGLTKYSQVFDFTEKEINIEGKNNNLSDNLYVYYHGLYEKSFLALHYPCMELTIYVCGVIHVANTNGEIENKIVVCREKNILPKIKIFAEKDSAAHYTYTPISTKDERNNVYGEDSNIVEYKSAILNTPWDIVHVQYYNMTEAKITIKEAVRVKSAVTNMSKKCLFIGKVEKTKGDVHTCSYSEVLDNHELWEYFDMRDFMNTFRML